MRVRGLGCLRVLNEKSGFNSKCSIFSKKKKKQLNTAFDDFIAVVQCFLDPK